MPLQLPDNDEEVGGPAAVRDAQTKTKGDTAEDTLLHPRQSSGTSVGTRLLPRAFDQDIRSSSRWTTNRSANGHPKLLPCDLGSAGSGSFSNHGLSGIGGCPAGW